MESQDEDELRRLSELLRTIDGQLDSSSTQREALQKAGLALSLAFRLDLRADVEREYGQLGRPITEAQRAHLRSMGNEPDE